MNSTPVEPRITEYLYQKATLSGVPLSGTFELTPVCNMNCKMCYVKISKAEQESIRPLRTAKEWLKLASEFKSKGMLYLLLTGGEPFLHPEFREIMQGLHKMGLLITINSNGTLITEETVDWLKHCPPVRINISVYGANNKTYERLCNNPNGFTKVSNAIKLLKQAHIPVKLNCSITPHNAEDIPQIFQFAKENELILQSASYMFPPIRRDAFSVGKNERFSPEDAAYYTAYTDYLTLGKERFIAAGEKLSLPCDNDNNCTGEGDGVRCRAGRCSFWITWEGYMTPCGMFPTDNSNNVFEKDPLSCWENVKYQTSLIRLPAECSVCSLKDSCHACAAMVITESGDFSKVPEYRCKMTKAYPYEYKKLLDKLEEKTYE